MPFDSPHEQRVVEQAAQPTKRQTDRGLGKAKILAGSRHASGLVDLVENRQELHIHYLSFPLGGIVAYWIDLMMVLS